MGWPAPWGPWQRVPPVNPWHLQSGQYVQYVCPRVVYQGRSVLVHWGAFGCVPGKFRALEALPGVPPGAPEGSLWGCLGGASGVCQAWTLPQHTGGAQGVGHDVGLGEGQGAGPDVAH